MYKSNGVYRPELVGDVDIFSSACEDEIDGTVERWREVFIHGDPTGLRSLARLLLQIADADQESENWPVGAREHVQLEPGQQLAVSSDRTVIGRLDAKGTGEYYQRFAPRRLQ